MRLSSLALLSLCAVARADSSVAAPALRFEWLDAWNRHWAGNAGADGANHGGTVTLTLGAGGRCQVLDKGKTDSSLLDGDRHEEKTMEWTTSWQGTWKIAGKKLTLSLAPVRERSSCTRISVERRGAIQYLPHETPCDRPLATVVLECGESPLDVDGGTEPAWLCRAPGDIGPASPFPWAFSRARCLRRLGQGAMSYARCER